MEPLEVQLEIVEVRRVVLQRIVKIFEEIDDCGPPDESYKSDQLVLDLNELRKLLGMKPLGPFGL